MRFFLFSFFSHLLFCFFDGHQRFQNVFIPIQLFASYNALRILQTIVNIAHQHAHNAILVDVVHHATCGRCRGTAGQRLLFGTIPHTNCVELGVHSAHALKLEAPYCAVKIWQKCVSTTNVSRNNVIGFSQPKQKQTIYLSLKPVMLRPALIFYNFLLLIKKYIFK